MCRQGNKGHPLIDSLNVPRRALTIKASASSSSSSPPATNFLSKKLKARRATDLRRAGGAGAAVPEHGENRQR